MTKAAKRIETGLMAGVTKIEASRPALSWREDRLAQLHWYGITTRSGAEFVVEAMLERSGLVAIVPAQRVFRRVNRYVRRKHEVIYPLLPRYVLIGFDAKGSPDYAPPWRQKVYDLPIPVLPVGIEPGVPWRMDGLKVAAFLKLNGQIKAADAERYMRTHKEFAEGDLVNIVEGGFAGHSGRVHVISGAVAKVLLPLFGSAGQDVPIPLANLERAE